MVVNGKVCGVAVYGNVSAEQIRKGMAIVETIATLKRQIAELFGDDIAEAIVGRLGISDVQLTDCNLSEEENQHLAYLAQMGVIGKAK